MIQRQLLNSARPTRIGYAELRSAEPEEFSRNAPSLYADPLAWMAADAVRLAIRNCDEDLLSAREDTGVIAVSAHGTLMTMRGIARQARRGRVSPLQFAGANPGSLAGVACMEWQLRGPSLVLAMRPADAEEVVGVIGDSWLHGGQASYVLVVAHDRTENEHVMSCTVLRAATEEGRTE